MEELVSSVLKFDIFGLMSVSTELRPQLSMHPTNFTFQKANMSGLQKALDQSKVRHISHKTCLLLVERHNVMRRS